MNGSPVGRWAVGVFLVGAALAGCSGPPSAAPEIWVEPVTGMELVRIGPGEFWMGTPEDEPMREPQELRHRVRLSRPFYLGRYEVTQAQWERVTGERPSHFADCGGDCPVENVAYVEIQRFLDRLVELGGARLRLPTEAEWEWVCRAGGEEAFGERPTLDADDANFDGRTPYPGAQASGYRAEPTPVGTFPPNRWGLYDLHGNVWEWCEDLHCPYPAESPERPVVDPLGECASPYRVIRGGSWYFGPDSARCGLRYTHRPVDRGPSVGFRLALDAEEANAPAGDRSRDPASRRRRTGSAPRSAVR